MYVVCVLDVVFCVDLLVLVVGFCFVCCVEFGFVGIDLVVVVCVVL